MPRLLATIAIIATVAAGACRNDEPVGPGSGGVPGGTGSQPAPPSLTAALVSPQTAVLLQGAGVRLVVRALDNYGRVMTGLATIGYASTDTSIASVDRGGDVTARGPGRAMILVNVTSGSVTAFASMEVQVFAVPTGTGNVLVSGPDGWEPTPLEVTAGSVVTWLAAPVNWAGTPHDKVYLLNPNYFVIDSLTMTNGIGTYRVGEPGTLRYCSGGCWDPPDFGVIYIR